MTADPVGAPPDAGSPLTADTADTADAVARVVLAVPGVFGLHAGAFGTVATHLPGRRVTGVAVRHDDAGRPRVEVCVTASAERGLRTDLHALASRVHAAVAPLVPGGVDVTIADLGT